MPEPPAASPCRPWKFDSGCAPDACAWRFHLESVGLDPTRLHPLKSTIRLSNDAVAELPIRPATLWLMSNIPALHHAPYPVELIPGLPFYDRAPRRTANLFPLLGMGALRRAGLTVKIDFKAATLSVWTPAPWHRGLSLFFQRLSNGFATIPFKDICEDA